MTMSLQLKDVQQGLLTVCQEVRRPKSIIISQLLLCLKTNRQQFLVHSLEALASTQNTRSGVKTALQTRQLHGNIFIHHGLHIVRSQS